MLCKNLQRCQGIGSKLDSRHQEVAELLHLLGIASLRLLSRHATVALVIPPYDEHHHQALQQATFVAIAHLLSKPDDLWRSDVTGIHIRNFSWWYAVTVINYYSRYLLACHLTPSQSTHDPTAMPEKAWRDVAHNGGFSGRVPTLVPDNGACFVSRRFYNYASVCFHYVRTQFRTTQPGLLERFHGTLNDEERCTGIYTTVRQMHVARWPRIGRAITGFARRVQPVDRDPLVRAVVDLDRLVVTIPKWKLCARATRKKLLEITGELRISNTNDNRDISPEMSMDIQVEWINPCLAK